MDVLENGCLSLHRMETTFKFKLVQANQYSSVFGRCNILGMDVWLTNLIDLTQWYLILVTESRTHRIFFSANGVRSTPTQAVTSRFQVLGSPSRLMPPNKKCFEVLGGPNLQRPRISGQKPKTPTLQKVFWCQSALSSGKWETLKCRTQSEETQVYQSKVSLYNIEEFKRLDMAVSHNQRSWYIDLAGSDEIFWNHSSMLRRVQGLRHPTRSLSVQHLTLSYRTLARHVWR